MLSNTFLCQINFKLAQDANWLCEQAFDTS